MEDASTRPNIRIEIHNNLAPTPMDVDCDETNTQNAVEDGEISEKNDSTNKADTEKPSAVSSKTWPSPIEGFTTGVNIFAPDEVEKLEERAKRFGITQTKSFTDDQLQRLHDSLGITIDGEKNIRFEAIHMQGTENMSTEDIFDYFGKYGPAYIEWIHGGSCNVVWNDKISAVRALHFTSQPIKGMPVEGPSDPFAKELALAEPATENSDAGRSILLVNKNREIELQKEDENMDAVDENKENSEGTVHISEITIPIPPGYWRLGISHPKAKFVLLRFAIKTDKNPMRAERFSEYYKNHGNHNFGELKGIISESRKKKFKGIFDRNKEINQSQEDDVKNPWGTLAENWDEDAPFCEKEYKDPDVIAPIKPESPLQSLRKTELMNRLGFKRAHVSEPVVAKEIKKPKAKIPRMRMYADEEEDKIKRKKQLLQVKLHKAIKQEPQPLEDLRNMLGLVSKKVVQPTIEIPAQEILEDLGTRLKNRKRILRHSEQKIPEILQSREIPRIRHAREDKHRTRPARNPDPPPSHRQNHNERTRYEGKLQADRYLHRRQGRFYSDDEIDHRKPQSKVAVVIKTQKRPTVASAIWSRINTVQKSTSETRRYGRKHKSSSESSDDSDSSESSSSSSSSSEGDSSSSSKGATVVEKSKAPRPALHIQISNDRFKKKQ